MESQRSKLRLQRDTLGPFRSQLPLMVLNISPCFFLAPLYLGKLRRQVLGLSPRMLLGGIALSFRLLKPRGRLTMARFQLAVGFAKGL